MKILILGIDGYLGWSLANYFAKEDYSISGIDGFFRRRWVKEMGAISALPIASMKKRIQAYQNIYKKDIFFYQGDITNYDFLSRRIKDIQPDVIIHFAQCPSSPYSMMNHEKSVWVQKNNLIGTLNLIYAVKEYAPDAHIVKLGTMGEYGTPNMDIPEGFFEIEYKGKKDRLPFPKQANSWYHLSKVHDSNNLQFACRNFGIKCTDIMQGVVFGSGVNNFHNNISLYNRLDFDQAFGTVINRFCCESVISHAITIYGSGTQIRSFLPLKDCMRCIKLVISNPPAKGEYKVINQFANIYSINQLASKVAGVCHKLNIEVKIENISNPRKEAESHYYNPENQNLKNLGYTPSTDFEDEIRGLILSVMPFRKRIAKYSKILSPTINW